MRILLVCQKLPAPLTDGYNLRIHNYLRHLVGRHEIHLLALEEGTLPAELASKLASVRTVPVRPVPRNGLLIGAAQFLQGRHRFDFDPVVMQALERALERARPDVVWVSGWMMLQYTRRLAGVPVFADVIDEGVRDAWGAVRRSRGPRQLVRTFKDFLSTLSYERHAFRHARICNVVSEVDRDAVRKVLPRLEVSVVHNGVDSDYFAPQPELEQPATLVFEGAMSYGPNWAAAVWFCREVFPLVLAAEPRARLSIVGRDPVPEVQALAGPAVEVTGFVDDVRPYLARGAVFVAPLVSGAGIKNKILQAWAMERAVVGTTLATSGLRVEPGVNFLVADLPTEFCAACVRLFADARERAALGAAGRATVVRHYSWEAKSREMELLLERASAPGP